MSIIVKEVVSARYYLLVKGADSVIFPRLLNNSNIV